MRGKILLFVLLIILGMDQQTNAQRLKRNKLNYEYLEYPYVNLSSNSEIQITVFHHSQWVNADSYRGARSRKNLSSKYEKSEFFSPPQVSFQSKKGSVRIEIAFSELQVVSKEEAVHTIGCKIKGTKINSIKSAKKNLKQCDGYYYKIGYQLPVILRITHENHQLLFSDQLQQTLHTTFGYDSTGLTGFLKKEALKDAFEKSGLKSLDAEAHGVTLSLLFNKLNKALFFKKVEESQILYSARSRDYNYKILDEAIQRVEDFLRHNEEGKESIDLALNEWEELLEKKDLVDKNAKINWKVAAILNANLAITYMLKHNFDKAQYHSGEFKRLSALSSVTLFKERAREVHDLIQYRKEKFDAFQGLMDFDSLSSAPDILSHFLNRKNELQIERDEAKYSTFQQSQNLEESLADKGIRKGKEKEATNEEKKHNKYRDRLQFTSVQGHILYLTPWVASDLKGKSLPVEVCLLTELNELRVMNLNLNSVPDEIQALVNLTRLDLSGNRLSELPNGIENLHKLKVLNLSRNNLKDLPMGISKLTNLKKLVVKDNPMSAEYIKELKKILPKKCKVKY